jgi:hypothetical protein
MNSYLLLRDNKQSGPHTFDELKDKGLKAYDLVWVEGKSAAWRYPCEISELSSFAPPVDEQPFDRFYKKPAQLSTTHSSSDEHVQSNKGQEVRLQNSNYASGTPRTAPNGAIAATILTGDTSSNAAPGRRIIYVTLPAGKTAPVAAPAARETRERDLKETPIAREEMPMAREHVTSLREAMPPAREEVPPTRENLPSVQEMQRQEETPLIKESATVKRAAAIPIPVGDIEDIPSQYNSDWKASVETTPRTHVKRSSIRLGQGLLVGVTVMALLVAGIFIGMSLNKRGSDKANQAAIGNIAEKPPVTGSSQPLAANHPPAPAMAGTVAKDSVVSNVSTNPALVAAPMPVVTPHKSLVSKERNGSASQKLPTAAPALRDSSLTALPVAQREATHRADITTDKIDKDAIRSNLSNLVSIGANKYNVGTFGGISDLQLTVSNRSTYSLDLVVVEVQYIQANKKVFKTENLYFRGIAPGSALMQEAPKSSRGIKVQYKITLVNSKELGLSYSTL